MWFKSSNHVRHIFEIVVRCFYSPHTFWNDLVYVWHTSIFLNHSVKKTQIYENHREAKMFPLGWLLQLLLGNLRLYLLEESEVLRLIKKYVFGFAGHPESYLYNVAVDVVYCSQIHLIKILFIKLCYFKKKLKAYMHLDFPQTFNLAYSNLTGQESAEEKEGVLCYLCVFKGQYNSNVVSIYSHSFRSVS